MLCRLRHISSEGKQDTGCHNIKYGMRVRDLRDRIARCQRFHKRHIRRHHADNRKNSCSDYIEHQVDNGCSLGIYFHTDGSQYRCNAGSDILSEKNIHRA